jgi:colicin import membrane protein
VTAFNGYPFSVMLALIMHGLIIGVLLFLQRADSEVLDVVRPPAVKALLVQENPQARNEQAQQQRQEQQRQEQRRQEQQRQEQQRQEQARQEAARQEQVQREQAAREEAARQEEQRQTALRQQREREQQQQAEQQRQQDEARRQEQERQRQEQARQEEQRRAADAAAAAQAAADSQAREVAETEAEMVMAYTAAIHDAVQRAWSRPPSARNNMTTVLRIRLIPTGEVVDVEIVRSSGDAAFDRAAETAVRSVGRFHELQGMPPRMFERNFRSLLLTFRPEDLLN